MQNTLVFRGSFFTPFDLFDRLGLLLLLCFGGRLGLRLGTLLGLGQHFEPAFGMLARRKFHTAHHPHLLVFATLFCPDFFMFSTP